MKRIPEGIYLIETKSWGWSKAKTGSSQFWVQGLVLGTPKDEADLSRGFVPLDGPPISRTVIETLTTNTFDQFVTKLTKALGWDGLDVTQLDPKDPKAIDLTGVRFCANCQWDTYNGKDREKWQISRKSALQELDKDSIEDLQARFQERLREKATARQAVAVK